MPEELAIFFSFLMGFRCHGEENQAEGCSSERGNVGKTRQKIVGGGFDFGKPLSVDGRGQCSCEGADDGTECEWPKVATDRRKVLAPGLVRRVGFECFADVENRKRRCGGGRRRLTEHVARKGAEGHCKNQCDEPDGGADKCHDGHCLKTLESLLGARDDGTKVCDKSAEENQKRQRARGNPEPFVEKWRNQICPADTNDEEGDRDRENILDKRLHLAIFAASRVSVDVFREDHCDDGKRNGQKGGELLEREDCAKLLGADVLRDQP